MATQWAPPDAPPWARSDPQLRPWLPVLADWHMQYERTLRRICELEGSLHAFCFTHGLHSLGLQREAHGYRYREWAPAALAVSLIGDFNGWDMRSHPCRRNADGIFEVFVPDDGSTLRPGGRYKARVHVRTEDGGDEWVDRVPAWARSTTQDAVSGEFYAVVPEPLHTFAWRHPRPPAPVSLRVYEVHVGISSSEPVIAGWAHFRTHVLPRVKRLGYSALLLIGVQEHGYYASFGYQVTSFFAPSSRFGSAQELQSLIDEAHGLGLLVLFELVHAHGSSNPLEGLSTFDGSPGQYFLPGTYIRTYVHTYRARLMARLGSTFCQVRLGRMPNGALHTYIDTTYIRTYVHAYIQARLGRMPNGARACSTSVTSRSSASSSPKVCACGHMGACVCMVLLSQGMCMVMSSPPPLPYTYACTYPPPVYICMHISSPVYKLIHMPSPPTLPSQVCWFADTYRVDGFRFDAVSAALYRHRSLAGSGEFMGGYDEYFGSRSGKG